jgi:hypothetical protein
MLRHADWLQRQSISAIACLPRPVHSKRELKTAAMPGWQHKNRVAKPLRVPDIVHRTRSLQIPDNTRNPIRKTSQIKPITFMSLSVSAAYAFQR